MLLQLLKLSKKFSLCLIMIIAIAFNLSLAVAERPKPPDTGTPSGNTTPGTTRPRVRASQTLLTKGL